MCVAGRICFLVIVATLSVAPALAAQPAQPQQQDEFVPMSEVPPEEQLPAQPLVAAAYGLVWLAILGYVASVSRRLERVQDDLQRLEGDVKRSARV